MLLEVYIPSHCLRAYQRHQKLSDPMRSSTLPQYTKGRGSSTRNSLPKVRRSSSRPTRDGCRMMMLLMVDEADEDTLVWEEYESRADDEDAREDRRKESRRREGEKRAETASKREVEESIFDYIEVEW